MIRMRKIDITPSSWFIFTQMTLPLQFQMYKQVIFYHYKDESFQA